MKIERCVVYFDSSNPMLKVNYGDDQRRIAITLPKIKGLDPEKYRPYREEIKKEKTISLLTPREKEAYELFSQGSELTAIARKFHTSSRHVKKLIRQARLKERNLKK